jgi:hypothetical protein
MLEARGYDVDGVTDKLNGKTVLGKEVAGARKVRRFRFAESETETETEAEVESNISVASLSEQSREKLDGNELVSDVNSAVVDDVSEKVEANKELTKENVIE